jgi:glycosyltransferase involved in cell wall biosynthesis
MRLTLVISSLSGGGAERALVLLAKGLLENGHEVSVVTLYGEDADFYQLSKKIKRLALNIANDSPTLVHAIWNNISRIAILRTEICLLQPDIVISFLKETNILTLLALTNTDIPVLMSEQNNPNLDSSGSVWDKLRNLTYPKATKLVSCSKGVDNYFDWIPERKRAVIYNPLTSIEDDNNTITLPEKVDLEKKTLVAMGRLTYQKGFDILLSAFNKIAHKYPQWQLVILGEGELRQQLEDFRDELGLNHQVSFPGQIKNPFPVLKKSEIFILSSRYEGFGNVIIEAMGCGLPVIATDCPSGPREIIHDGVDGILVPTEDVCALAASMEHLMSNPEIAIRLGNTAKKTVNRFSLERIVENWEALIAEVSQHQGKYNLLNKVS